MHRVPTTRPVAEKPDRIRDEAYRKHVASQPCLLCGGTDVQAAHMSFGNYARGVKAGDDLCLPLCVKHHGMLDQGMGPRTFWRATLQFRQDLMLEMVRAYARQRYRDWLER